MWLETKEVCWDFWFQFISMQVTELRAPSYTLPAYNVLLPSISEPIVSL